MVRYVRCINSSHSSYLEEGKIYKVIREDTEYKIESRPGEKYCYPKDRFEIVFLEYVYELW